MEGVDETTGATGKNADGPEPNGTDGNTGGSAGPGPVLGRETTEIAGQANGATVNGTEPLTCDDGNDKTA